MPSPPRYFATILFALFAFFAFLIPLILVIYTGHAFFFGPAWLSSQPGAIQVTLECFMAILGGFGLLAQWFCFWFIGFIMAARARYEWEYARYIRAGHNPQEWGRISLS